MNKKIIGTILILCIKSITAYIINTTSNQENDNNTNDENTFVIGFATYPPLSY